MNENEKLKEKLELLSALKEDEENHKEKKKKDTPKEQKSVSPKKSKTVTEKKDEKRILLTIISFIAFVTSLTYLIYNIVKANDQVNQPYLIIHSCCLLFFTFLLSLIAFTTNRKTQKKLQVLGVISIVLYTTFEFLVTSNTIVLPTLKTVKDFRNTSINEVIKWASENKITLDQNYEYSDSIESDHIISQNIPANTPVHKIKKLEVIVSNGPNYESIVNIPNMIGWNIDDVVKKIKELKLNKVTINYEFHETIEKDIAYEQSKSGEIRRNEELVIAFSLGKESDLKPVNLIELSGQNEFDAILWLKKHGIKYQIQYEFDQDIESGNVITTTPQEGTLIDQKETTVTVIVSKGPKIIAPDLMTMSLEDITEWAIKNKLILSYESEYSSEVKAGDIIRVSVKKGDTLEENERIYIITSKGTLKMISYVDGDIINLRKFATENKITLTESEEFHETIEKGKFISISKKPGETINAGEEIKVSISLGKSAEIPNFIGMSSSKAQSTCKNLGLTCKISYVYSSKTKGTVFNQSMSAGSKVIGGANIVLTVSNGPRPSNSGGSSSNNNPSNPTVPTCTEKEIGILNIQESWLSIGSSSKTISSLKSKLSATYPGATFNIVAKEHNSINSGLIHPNSPVNTGTLIKSCRTYTIYVVE